MILGTIKMDMKRKYESEYDEQVVFFILDSDIMMSVFVFIYVLNSINIIYVTYINVMNVFFVIYINVMNVFYVISYIDDINVLFPYIYLIISLLFYLNYIFIQLI